MAKLTENLKLEVPEGSDTFTRASYAKLITDIDERVASKQDLDGEADVLHSKTTDIDGRVKRHVGDKNNPHNVTKAQVGLCNVQNYPVANVTQVEDGTATDAYMTPATTKLAIDKHAGDALKGHTDDFNNPHKVTKSQVGLGNVRNYSPATVADAEAGTATNKYMTPSTTKKAIDKHAGDAVKDHTENYNNPHRVTKTQVGLGNVDNVKQATKTEHNTLKSRVDNLHAKDIKVTSTNLESKDVAKALDELFTYADDVHARWASSVGAPLKKSDTAEVKERKTRSLLIELDDRLRSEGYYPEGNELKDIIESIFFEKKRTIRLSKSPTKTGGDTAYMQWHIPFNSTVIEEKISNHNEFLLKFSGESRGIRRTEIDTNLKTERGYWTKSFKLSSNSYTASSYIEVLNGYGNVKRKDLKFSYLINRTDKSWATVVNVGEDFLLDVPFIVNLLEDAGGRSKGILICEMVGINSDFDLPYNYMLGTSSQYPLGEDKNVNITISELRSNSSFKDWISNLRKDSIFYHWGEYVKDEYVVLIYNDGYYNKFPSGKMLYIKVDLNSNDPKTVKII